MTMNSLVHLDSGNKFFVLLCAKAGSATATSIICAVFLFKVQQPEKAQSIKTGSMSCSAEK